MQHGSRPCTIPFLPTIRIFRQLLTHTLGSYTNTTFCLLTPDLCLIRQNFHPFAPQSLGLGEESAPDARTVSDQFQPLDLSTYLSESFERRKSCVSPMTEGAKTQVAALIAAILQPVLVVRVQN